MATRPWSRVMAGLLGLWLTLVWAGPDARVNCPMHAGTVATGPAAHGHHAPHAPADSGGDHGAPEHQGCNCTWCPTGTRQAMLDTARLPEPPVVVVATVASAPLSLLSAELASTPHQLPFAIGPPTA